MGANADAKATICEFIEKTNNDNTIIKNTIESIVEAWDRDVENPTLISVEILGKLLVRNYRTEQFFIDADKNGIEKRAILYWLCNVADETCAKY
mgnify:FL=1